jgi:hypothetical protein
MLATFHLNPQVDTADAQRIHLAVKFAEERGRTSKIAVRSPPFDRHRLAQ